MYCKQTILCHLKHASTFYVGAPVKKVADIDIRVPTRLYVSSNTNMGSMKKCKCVFNVKNIRPSELQQNSLRNVIIDSGRNSQ